MLDKRYRTHVRIMKYRELRLTCYGVESYLPLYGMRNNSSIYSVLLGTTPPYMHYIPCLLVAFP